MSTINLILFDIGGVVVEQSGVDTLHAWMGHRFTTDEIWEYWTHAPEIHAFECGNLSREDFAMSVIRDLKLPVTPSEFIQEFTSWPVGFFPLAQKQLLELRRNIPTACYTNTNELHWPRLRDEFGIPDLFTHSFASHETGITKPDVQAFEHVCDTLNTNPNTILFFDDNLTNVKAAESVGLLARHVKGWAAVQDELRRMYLPFC